MSVPWGTATLTPSLCVPSGRLPKPAMTLPRTGQRNLAAAASGAGGSASLVTSLRLAIFCVLGARVALMMRGGAVATLGGPLGETSVPLQHSVGLAH